MAFKMKGHTLPGIKQLKSNDLDDGRSGSAAFQQIKKEEATKNIIKEFDLKEDPPKNIIGGGIAKTELGSIIPLFPSYTPPNPVLGQKASWALGFADNPGEEEKSSD